MSLSRRALRGGIGFAVAFLVLEVFTRVGFASPEILPHASTMVATAAGLLVDPSFLAVVGITIRSMVTGFLLAAAIGVVAGVILGSYHSTYVACSALIEFLRPIPAVALIPVAVLFLGVGTGMTVTLVVLSVVWPILFNTLYGMQAVDPIARETARSFGIDGAAILLKISIPSALPFIYTGVRIAAPVALLVAISVELLTGAPGLGRWLAQIGAEGARPDLVYGGVLISGLLGWAMNWVLVRVEHRFLAWQPALRAVA